MSTSASLIKSALGTIDYKIDFLHKEPPQTIRLAIVEKSRSLRSESAEVLDKVSDTLCFLTNTYDSEFFTERKKQAFFELLANEPDGMRQFVFHLHSEHYATLIKDATTYGYAGIVLREAGNGIQHVGQIAYTGTVHALTRFAGLFTACAPPAMMPTSPADEHKKSV